MSEENSKFAAPAETETREQTIARLRAKAELQAEQEFDEEAVYAQLLAEARAAQQAKLMKSLVDLPTDCNGLPKEYVWVEIDPSQNPEDRSFVPLGLNGLVVKVPRGRKVVLHKVMVDDCLATTVEAKLYKTARDGYILRPSKRFPYSLLGPATEEDYQQFIAAEREQEARELAAVA